MATETDGKVNHDFISRIVNVSFGGLWCVVTTDVTGATAGGGLNVPVSTTLSFPGFAGGTPGFEIRTGGLINFPHSVTKSDLAHKGRTAAGLAFAGEFGVTKITPPPHSPLNNQLYASSDILDFIGYSNASQFFFTTPSQASFEISLAWVPIQAGGGSGIQEFVSFSATCFLKKSQDLLGKVVPLALPAEYPSPLQASYTPLGASAKGGTVRFRVDPGKNVVTLLTPNTPIS